MLRKLHIRNFKAWKDTGEIRLAPLTVFFGTNSSGKSSLNQFILALKQTAQSPDRQRVLHLGDKSTLIDLGTYRDVTYNHSESGNIDFSLEWDLEKKFEFEDVLSPNKIYAGNSMFFNGEIGPAGGKRQDLVVMQMAYRLGDPKKNGLEILMRRKVTEGSKKDEYELESKNYNLVRKQGRGWPLPSPIRFYGFPEETIAYYQNADLVSDLTLSFEHLLQKIHYLGPLREHPHRSYIWSGEIPEHVGWKGERTIDAILSAKDRQINLPRKKKQLFEAVIAFWLKQMGLIESFEVKKVAPDRREYEVLIKTAGSSDNVNLTDVGFGISQVLPVLVECFYCEPNSTLILEQPEIHLHPSVQASLADLFIAAVKSRENNSDRNIQLLVESHSEHFLRRLQRRIAEEAISPEMTAIYFCQPSNLGSTIRTLAINEYGDITNWPKNFFGNETADLVAMTEAAINRKQGDLKK
jgi:predicted ATPase